MKKKHYYLLGAALLFILLSAVAAVTLVAVSLKSRVTYRQNTLAVEEGRCYCEYVERHIAKASVVADDLVDENKRHTMMMALVDLRGMVRRVDARLAALSVDEEKRRDPASAKEIAYCLSEVTTAVRYIHDHEGNLRGLPTKSSSLAYR